MQQVLLKLHFSALFLCIKAIYFFLVQNLSSFLHTPLQTSYPLYPCAVYAFFYQYSFLKTIQVLLCNLTKCNAPVLNSCLVSVIVYLNWLIRETGSRGIPESKLINIIKKYILLYTVAWQACRNGVHVRMNVHHEP